jgi:hypothetical protein
MRFFTRNRKRFLSSLSEPYSIMLGNQSIPYPRGAMSPIHANQVYKFGADAVSEMFEESHHSAKLLNSARLHYLDFRARLFLASGLPLALWEILL